MKRGKGSGKGLSYGSERRGKRARKGETPGLEPNIRDVEKVFGRRIETRPYGPGHNE